jgi:hypothetical protein
MGSKCDLIFEMIGPIKSGKLLLAPPPRGIQVTIDRLEEVASGEGSTTIRALEVSTDDDMAPMRRRVKLNTVAIFIILVPQHFCNQLMDINYALKVNKAMHS